MEEVMSVNLRAGNVVPKKRRGWIPLPCCVWDVRSSGLFWSIVKFDILFDKEASPRYCEHLKFCHKLDWHNVHISDIRS
ncbi:hypothetical protein MtrunA17_Chr1g0212441 [Medicago truncatula]|uniref:Uncharacterized protein n=1 Tax=Medicago truncatula TaxID=3880 RepID=A0A396K4Y4_MEDTR|nr:hypothetical protein MtrunA17_Chr1g0212441 [Medicago truncatula]